jgi:hypothetical protein
MFDVVAGWFAAGMFVAGSWIVVGSFLPTSRTRPGASSGRRPRTDRSVSR